MFAFLLGFACGLFMMSGGLTSLRDWIQSYLKRP